MSKSKKVFGTFTFNGQTITYGGSRVVLDRYKLFLMQFIVDYNNLLLQGDRVDKYTLHINSILNPKTVGIGNRKAKGTANSVPQALYDIGFFIKNPNGDGTITCSCPVIDDNYASKLLYQQNIVATANKQRVANNKLNQTHVQQTVMPFPTGTIVKQEELQTIIERDNKELFDKVKFLKENNYDEALRNQSLSEYTIALGNDKSLTSSYFLEHLYTKYPEACANAVNKVYNGIVNKNLTENDIKIKYQKEKEAAAKASDIIISEATRKFKELEKEVAKKEAEEIAALRMKK